MPVKQDSGHVIIFKCVHILHKNTAQEISVYNIKPFEWILWQSGHSLLEKKKTVMAFLSYCYPEAKIHVCFGRLQKKNVSVCVILKRFLYSSLKNDNHYILEFQLIGVFNSGCVLINWLYKSPDSENFIGFFVSMKPKTMTSMVWCVLFLCTWRDTNYWFSLLLYYTPHRDYVCIFDDVGTWISAG